MIKLLSENQCNKLLLKGAIFHLCVFGSKELLKDKQQLLSFSSGNYYYHYDFQQSKYIAVLLKDNSGNPSLTTGFINKNVLKLNRVSASWTNTKSWFHKKEA